MKKLDIDIYMLCPVRKATEQDKEFLKEYKRKQEERGFRVHYPADDTAQEDNTGGYRICMDHCDEISRARTVHVYWTASSTGSYVDLGTSLLEHHKRDMDILLINRGLVEKIVEEQTGNKIMKSYERVLLRLDELADSETRLE